MATNLDVRFQSAIADHLPAAVVNPTHGLETLARGLQPPRRPARALALRGRGHRAPGRRARAPAAPRRRRPDFTGNQRWFNTPGGRPLTLAGLRGRSCSSTSGPTRASTACARCPTSRPGTRATAATAWSIVGVHSPEFPFEHDAGNVRAAIQREGIRYPVAQDNKLATWNAWGNQYWPAEYLIDAARPGPRRALRRGRLRPHRDGHPGAARRRPAIPTRARWPTPRAPCTRRALATPETYLGLARAERFDPPPLRGTHTYAQPPKLATSHFALAGTWAESASPRRPAPAPRSTPRSSARTPTSC